MVVAGGGFEPCYNAQALVDTEGLRVVVPQVTGNDKQQVVPEELNPPEQLLADAGCFSDAKVGACEAASADWTTSRANGPWCAWRGIYNAGP
jgi:hypothetical protein